ncbi:MAG: hypothetical protein LBK99_18905 [Opitutaceae bacterium]|nr:hypothetical protein [Opitutaceae bacterium]
MLKTRKNSRSRKLRNPASDNNGYITPMPKGAKKVPGFPGIYINPKNGLPVLRGTRRFSVMEIPNE